MRNNVNTEHIEGRIYQHSLELKTVQNKESENFGKQYIQGEVEVAVDDMGLNIIPVNFVFVTATTKKGAQNRTYTELMKIIDSGKTIIVDGMDNATMVSIDTSLAVNDFVASDGTMVNQMVNQGGFISIVSKLNSKDVRNTFKTDMIISNVERVSPENAPEFVRVRGGVFDFRNTYMPVTFNVRNEMGMKYFEDLEPSASDPVYTCVWGKVNFSKTTETKSEESAFGEAAVEVKERKVKEWLITGTSKITYDFGDDNVMTEDELRTALQNREVHLADVKRRKEEYEAQKAAATPQSSFSTPTAGGAIAKSEFKF